MIKENKEIKGMKEGMVDVGKKKAARRVAIASAQIKMTKKAFAILLKGGSPKGDVFETAKVAGIMAAKATPALIPMCHPLSLDKVSLSLNADAKTYSVFVKAEVVCHGKTGVEMESLVAASTAALTIYDMMKWADQGMVISNVQLLYKQGGRSGIYQR